MVDLPIKMPLWCVPLELNAQRARLLYVQQFDDLYWLINPSAPDCLEGVAMQGRDLIVTRVLGCDDRVVSLVLTVHVPRGQDRHAWEANVPIKILDRIPAIRLGCLPLRLEIDSEKQLRRLIEIQRWAVRLHGWLWDDLLFHFNGACDQHES